MLLCMISLAIEVDALVQLLTRIRHRVVSIRMHPSKITCSRVLFYSQFKLDARRYYSWSIHYMLAGSLNSRAVKYMQAQVSRNKHTGY